MLAIGFLLGGVFTALVSSFANDIIMAAITRAFGTSTNDWVLAPVMENGKVVGGIYIGKFISAIIQFVIVSGVVFGILYFYFWFKNYVAYRKALKNPVVEEPVAPAPAPTTEELILAELKKLNANVGDDSKSLFNAK
ncbi:large conductance mechanosensitive channel [Mycoplasmopsis verecunda]|uniref:Large conductance mechanosensitive channel n=2 Tax=Mycoplasmopsis verecunda TaxID=171291 RepID=A0A1T4KE45_9BACT|nr:large conductance mechanosensitive channel [Mycoplasmopsis verecunda]